VSGVYVGAFGWPAFLGFSVAAALPGLVLLRWLRSDVRRLDAARAR